MSEVRGLMTAETESHVSDCDIIGGWFMGVRMAGRPV